MYEVPANESGSWPIRVRGDNTCGNGELLAVPVEFNEAVNVDSETTFRIQIGSWTRYPYPADRRSETVRFATLIRSSDNDSNGVRIASTPEYGDTYVRNERIKIEAQFDQPVQTIGRVSARINSEALGSDALRFAEYD